ncbi:hypothetical protein FW796_30990 [Pseudomonas sp. 910_21]
MGQREPPGLDRSTARIKPERLDRSFSPPAWADAFAGKPAPTADRYIVQFPVGAGLPAKRPVRHVAPGRAPSLASQLLQQTDTPCSSPEEPACRRRGP